MNDRTTPSDPWGHGFDVNRLADRLDELADYVTQGADCVRRNFVMQVPAEPYHDADLVISTAARLLRDGLVTPPSPAHPPAWPVNLAELHDPDFSDGLTASQHLDVLRGGPDPRADQTEGPSLDDVAELCEEFEFHLEGDGLEGLHDMITAAITRWHAPVAQPVAQPVDVANLMRLTEGVDPYAPGDPDVGHILALAQILEEVDGRYDTYPEDAKAILAHPGFSGCHDGPVAPPAQGVLDDRYEFSVVDSDDCEQAGGSAPTLDDAIREGRNYLRQCNQDGPHKLELRRVLVLDCSEPANPATPLGLPTTNKPSPR
jgi:hypothetical protein